MLQHTPDEEWWGSDTFVVRNAESGPLGKIRERVRASNQLRAQYSKAKTRCTRSNSTLEIPIVVRPLREGGEMDDGEVLIIGDVVNWPEGTAEKILNKELFVATAAFTMPQQPRRKSNKRGALDKAASKGALRSRRHSLMQISIEQAESQGVRPSMEDRYLIHLFQDFVAVGVFDGHGGTAAADFVAERFIPILRAQFPEASRLALAESNPQLSDAQEHETVALMKRSLPAAVEVLEANAVEHLAQEKDYSGTTFCMCLCSRSTLIAANLGDTRVVLSRGGVAQQVTRDHGTKDPEERRRIKEMQGTITPDGYVGGLVQVSRAIGDLDPATNAKILGLIATPDVFEFPLEKGKDEFIIVACDGVWDVMAPQMAVNNVRASLRESNGDLAEAVKGLVQYALNSKTDDNVTAILVSLPAVDRIWTKQPASTPSSADDAGRPRLFLTKPKPAAAAIDSPTATPSPPANASPSPLRPLL